MLVRVGRARFTYPARFYKAASLEGTGIGEGASAVSSLERGKSNLRARLSEYVFLIFFLKLIISIAISDDGRPSRISPGVKLGAIGFCSSNLA